MTMTITVNKESFDARSGFFTTDRYFLIDAHGDRVGYSGWVQRPAAERQARYTGHGIYDRREDTVIVMPDHDRRRRTLQTNIDIARDQLASAEAELERLNAL